MIAESTPPSPVGSGQAGRSRHAGRQETLRTPRTVPPRTQPNSTLHGRRVGMLAPSSAASAQAPPPAPETAPLVMPDQLHDEIGHHRTRYSARIRLLGTLPVVTMAPARIIHRFHVDEGGGQKRNSKCHENGKTRQRRDLAPDKGRLHGQLGLTVIGGGRIASAVMMPAARADLSASIEAGRSERLSMPANCPGMVG